ncbi:hypothetical protein C8J57DRAFT_1725635 [Mycena rebaudengoi]|nr:hypothetical protein C8J57DRAFT_1725635 [Mycena rebaudengoi]
MQKFNTDTPLLVVLGGIEALTSEVTRNDLSAATCLANTVGHEPTHHGTIIAAVALHLERAHLRHFSLLSLTTPHYVATKAELAEGLAISLVAPPALRGHHHPQRRRLHCGDISASPPRPAPSFNNYPRPLDRPNRTACDSTRLVVVATSYSTSSGNVLSTTTLTLLTPISALQDAQHTHSRPPYPFSTLTTPLLGKRATAALAVSLHHMYIRSATREGAAELLTSAAPATYSTKDISLRRDS